MMLSLGIRFHDTAELPFEERVKAAEGQGFSCVHIALSKIKDIPSDISALTSGYANYLKGCFDKAGLSVAVLGNYLNLCDPDPDRLSGILKKYEGKEVVFGFRPEAIELGEKENSFVIKGEVELTEMLGDNTNVYMNINDDRAILKIDPHDTPEVDSHISFSIPYERVYLFDGETEMVIDG